MRLPISLVLLASVAAAGEPAVLLDFEQGEPGEGWSVHDLGLKEIAVPDGKTPSAGRALQLVSAGKREGAYRGLLGRPIAIHDWRTYRALSIHLAVEAKQPLELRVIAVRGDGPAGLVRRFTVEPGDWREVELPLKDFRENIFDQVGGFDRIDRLILRWDRGAGAVSLDDVRLLPGDRGVSSCAPTIEERKAVVFGADAKGVRAFEGEHFVVLTDVERVQEADVKPLLARLEAGLAMLRTRFGVEGEFDDKVPLCLFASLDGYTRAVARIGEHYGAGVAPPKAQGYSLFGLGLSVYFPNKGWERPVFVHEAMHGAIHRLLGVASNGNWIQEGLAPAVQATMYPDALDRAQFAKRFHAGKDGWIVPWGVLLKNRSIATRNYPQALSFMDYLAERHAKRLPQVWAAVRAVRGPLHEQAWPAIARALEMESDALEQDWLAWGPAHYAGD